MQRLRKITLEAMNLTVSEVFDSEHVNDSKALHNLLCQWAPIGEYTVTFKDVTFIPCSYCGTDSANGIHTANLCTN